MRLALLATLLLAACETPADVTWHQERGYRWRALDVPRRGDPGFTPLAARATGLRHANVVIDEHALANRNLLLGAGVAIGDVDEDGLPDLFLASVERPAALYRNDGGMAFTDVTAASGVRAGGLATLSAAFADVSGDGHLDLLVGTLGGPLKLWLGDGHGRFRDATAESGLTGGYAAAALALADVEGDGDLDLYVGTYKTRNVLDAVPPAQRTFDQVVRRVGDRYEVVPRWRADYRIEDRPDLGGVMRAQRAEPDLFFLNDGNGRFAAEPVAGARFRDESGAPLAEPPDHFTLAARFYDVNGDGAPDLYVCNDFEDPDQFWINDGRGGFRLIPALAMRETSNTCMSVDFADVNRDGHVDVFTADMMSRSLAQRQTQVPINLALPKQVGLGTERHQWMRNMLQVARGDGTWADVSFAAGVEASEWTWGSAFVDVDLDGWEDLLAVNGHRWDVRDADTFERLRAAVRHVPWNREQGEFPRHDARNVAWRNRGDLAFTDVSAAWRFGSDSAISNGLALGDLDGDGDLDAVVTRLGGSPVVYRSGTTAPRIAVRLRGLAGNREGVGARVTVRADGLPAQTREVAPSGYYLSGSDAMLVFAAGRDTMPALEVRWRDGATSTIQARPNRLYEIEQAGARPPSPTAPVDSSSLGLFENATSLLRGHAHVDSLFDDYRRQPLLPTRLSQLGPGVSWIDLDADGREDLVVGTGRGGRLALLRNGGSRFELSSGPRAPYDLTTVLPVPAPGGGLALLAGQSSYEAASADEALAVAPVLSFAVRAGTLAGPAAPLPPDTASIGPLALGDVNGDGRLDLFAGARVVPGAWPVPAPSRLYLREPDGGWRLDSANARPLAALGLVSAALFTDLDADGRAELVTTSEWGPVRVLRAERGLLRDVTRDWGLPSTTSRWNGLASGDFDGDGRLDLVVTSWGRNTPWQATPDRPYVLYAGDFGGAGLGLVFARRDSVTRREMPLESLTRVGIAAPAVRARYPTYVAWSGATVDDALGEAARRAVRVGATTFDHLLLLNRGGRFEPRPLPAAAQLAPAFGIVVADLDGDGREDLFLSQNFSPTAQDLPRFDAGAGLVLLGDGQGGFRASGVRESGIAVIGDGRGAAAADYDGDGRVDLAVSQNGGPTTLWHNRRARPGLRVRLDAGADNPLGIGARVQVASGARRGPARELHAGAGYWSMDAATTVLARPADATQLVVLWPGGREQVVPLPAPGNAVLTVRRP